MIEPNDELPEPFTADELTASYRSLPAANLEPCELTNKDYHLLRSVSHSSLECFRRSKREFKARYIDRTIEWKQTPAMLLGSVVHCMLLEPNRVGELYAILPKCDRRTNVGKDIYAEFVASLSGKEVVDRETYDQADSIALAVMGNHTARLLLDVVADREQPMYWTCPQTGIECRSKPDLLATIGMAYLLDVKTCQDSTPRGFASAAARFGYARQAAWYQWGCEQNGLGILPFIFVAVSTNEPYEVGIYDLSEHDLRRSKMQNEIDLAEFARCQSSGDWEGEHERNKVTLQLPKWADYEDQYQTY